MTKRPLLRFIVLLICAAGWLTVLPNQVRGVFLSPDETAVYHTAQQFARTGSMAIPESLVKEFPWAHPRSLVTLGESLVPVGFIGMPLLIGTLAALKLSFAGGYLTPLLVLLVAMCIWKIFETSSFSTRMLATVSWLTFPSVILYANRGLFPNLPAICLTLLGGYLLWQKRELWRSALAGICIVLALSIRPIDAFWILPWAFCAWRFREDRKQCQERKFLGTALLAGAVMLCVLAIVQARTYGSLFTIGYFLHDPIIQESVVRPSASAPVLEVRTWFPFGIHPMHVWFNFKQYILGYLWPWFLVALITTGIYWKKREARPWMVLGWWTLLSCMAVYGQGVYQDHIGVNVSSIGNSFLRYILPATAFVPLMVSALLKKLSDIQQRPAILAGFAMFGAMCAYGFVLAFYSGNEALILSSSTLQGYASLREASRTLVGPNAIVFSDRSDKIFFAPPEWKAVTPVPSLDHIQKLSQAHPELPVLYFGRPLSDDDLASWVQHGYMPRKTFVAGNEILYSMSAGTSTTPH